jgi:hypothetical protein
MKSNKLHVGIDDIIAATSLGGPGRTGLNSKITEVSVAEVLRRRAAEEILEHLEPEPDPIIVNLEQMAADDPAT